MAAINPEALRQIEVHGMLPIFRHSPIANIQTSAHI
jgi:hypothetical protein